MERFLFRVTYTYSDATVSHEPVCVVAADDDETDARRQVDEATDRYASFIGATKILTLVSVTADV